VDGNKRRAGDGSGSYRTVLIDAVVLGGLSGVSFAGAQDTPPACDDGGALTLSRLNRRRRSSYSVRFFTYTPVNTLSSHKQRQYTYTLQNAILTRSIEGLRDRKCPAMSPTGARGDVIPRRPAFANARTAAN
jgi:hypothetical protein